MTGNPSWWYRRSVADLQAEANADASERGLKRSLGLAAIVFLGVGSVIGTGIFVLTGTVAAAHAGPAVTLSYVLAGVVCMFAALCYAELASMIPVSGSAYSYAYATLGQLVAWIIAWNLILEYMIAASIIAVGWSGYVTAFLRDLGWAVPDALAAAPFAARGHALLRTAAWINLPAVLFVVLLTLLLMGGVRESARWNNAMVVVKVGAILLVIICAAPYVHAANWQPFIPPNSGEPGEFGWSGVFRGAAIVFFAFVGFDMVASAAQEAKRPERDMPAGIIGSLLICTILYLGMALVMTGVTPYSQLRTAYPVYVMLQSAGPALDWLRLVVTAGIVIGLASAALICLYGQSRIFYVMARDGLLPDIFARIDARTRTPRAGTLIVGAIAAVVAGVFPLDVLGELSSIGTLLAFMIVCAGVLVLRRLAPEAPRPFRVPAAPLVCTMGVLGCVCLMVSLPVETWVRLLVWLALGLLIYFLYSAPRSRSLQSRQPPVTPSLIASRHEGQ